MATTVESDFGVIDLDAREATGMTGVAIFNPALKGTGPNNNPIIILGLDGDDHALIVTDEGKLRWVPVADISTDWHYDWKKETWVDGSGEPAESE